MKRKLALLLAAVLAGGTAITSAFAAGDGYSGTHGAGQSSSPQAMEMQQSTSGPAGQSEFRAVADLDGMPIQNQQGEPFGKVEQLMVDMDDGRIAFLVISSERAGTGEQNYIVPWQMVRTTPQQDQLILDVASLNQLRPLAADEPMEETLTRAAGEEIFQFYGISPYWEEESEQQMPHDHMHPQMMEQMPQDEIHQRMMEQMHQPDRQPIPPKRP